MLACGDGSLSLWKYHYPDKRRIKVCKPCVMTAVDYYGALYHLTLAVLLRSAAVAAVAVAAAVAAVVAAYLCTPSTHGNPTKLHA
jgi:hypothetical protein